MITKGKIYQITNGNLKAKNAQFNKTEHDYELTLNRNSVIDEMDDDDEYVIAKSPFSRLISVSGYQNNGTTLSRSIR